MGLKQDNASGQLDKQQGHCSTSCLEGVRVWHDQEVNQQGTLGRGVAPWLHTQPACQDPHGRVRCKV